jgi:hypothetical protein
MTRKTDRAEPLAGAVGIHSMGREDGHADEAKDYG